jgi:hypothetical protein
VQLEMQRFQENAYKPLMPPCGRPERHPREVGTFLPRSVLFSVCNRVARIEEGAEGRHRHFIQHFTSFPSPVVRSQSTELPNSRLVDNRRVPAHHDQRGPAPGIRGFGREHRPANRCRAFSGPLRHPLPREPLLELWLRWALPRKTRSGRSSSRSPARRPCWCI